MALIDTIADKLITDGIVDGSTNWTVTKSYLPDTKNGIEDQVIAIFETQGAVPDECFFYPRFSVHIRGRQFEYDVARTKADQVVTSLDDITISGFIYLFLSSNVFGGGVDGENRPIVIANFLGMVPR